MSIYPVHLNNWFPKSENEDDQVYHEIMKSAARNGYDCLNCKKSKMDYRLIWGHHSIPWGHGDIWCTKRCYKQWQLSLKNK